MTEGDRRIQAIHKTDDQAQTEKTDANRRKTEDSRQKLTKTNHSLV